MRSTMPAISGRSDHTIAASPPGPSGTSIRAMPRGYAPLRDDLRVVVLGADLLDVLVPAAVVRVGVALAHRVLEVPGLALVRPVVRIETVGLAPVGDRGRVVAGAVQVLTELELGGGRRLGARARIGAGYHLVGRQGVATLAAVRHPVVDHRDVH